MVCIYFINIITSILLHIYILILLYIGYKQCCELSSHLKKEYIRKRFNSDASTWPPSDVQPKEYTKLAFTYRTGLLQPTKGQISTLAKCRSTGTVDVMVAADKSKLFRENSTDDDFEQSFKEYLQENQCTQNIVDILQLLEDPNNPGPILIEGAPGLGKTILTKQIAYEWANKKVLINTQLVFLIPLRDPKVQEFSSVIDLVKHFCNWDNEDNIISCTKYLEKIEGKNILIIFDGFDELPLELQKYGFFAEVIHCKFKKLCCSSIIITSRPHACAMLRGKVSSLVDILGFTTECQKFFLKSALQKSPPHKLQQILGYLDSNPVVSSLCFVPFNMTVLLWLYSIEASLDSLPSNSTELYNSFIFHTIKCHIKRVNPEAEIEYVKDDFIDKLPKQYKKILLKLSAFCLQMMDDEKQLKVVFTLKELKDACPNIDEVPGGINCFGLLQAIEHYSCQSTVVTSLNFIHLSVQEFLAAYQITKLSDKKELKYIQSNFWSDLHSNMFAMYVGLTKGQRPSFKKFLSDFGKTSTFSRSIFTGKSQSGTRIANELVKDERKCLRLFQCFYEANDVEACNTVAKKFYDSKMIRLNMSNTPLLPNYLQCLKFFLTKSSNKQWIQLNLANCSIRDTGISVLHKILSDRDYDITIDEIILNNNSLTAHALQDIAEITISSKAKVLDLSFNSIECDTSLEKLAVAASSMQSLYLSFNKLASEGTIAFLSSLQMSKKITLTVLEINSNSIDDKSVKVITEFLKENQSLEVLRIYGNQIREDSMDQIANSLHENNTLKEIMFDTCSPGLRQKLKSIERLINSNRISGIFIKFRFAEIIYANTKGGPVNSVTMYPKYRT